MIPATEHPVWSVYDEQRTARLNVLYLDAQIRKLRNCNIWTEIVIAVATSSSVGGFWFFNNAVGGYIWKIMGVIAVLLSVIKPIVKLADRIRKKEELAASYRILDHDLHCIHIEVRHKRSYDEGLHKEFLKALKRKSELVRRNDDSPESERVLRRLEERVWTELPSEGFYVPEN